MRDIYSSFPKDFKPFDDNEYWFGIDYPSGVIGHFTQLVWHSTFNVGCGFVQTKTNQENRWKSVSINISILLIYICIHDFLNLLSKGINK